MAVESLNKVLKYNKMNGQWNIKIEKLLDLLEDLVKEKMWKTIINSERPNANNYQHKVTVAAHKKAELQFQIEIELIDCGVCHDTTTTRICSRHFLDDDFCAKEKLLNLPKEKWKLKKDAIPSCNLPKSPKMKNPSQIDRDTRMKKRCFIKNTQDIEHDESELLKRIMDLQKENIYLKECLEKQKQDTNHSTYAIPYHTFH
ncbi:hypothetical protein ABEB36_015352 [Hypothenemus hampei]|uniref:THAP-type domain-containing protein n=1 Tax=Hypothenemus hampei TaxID=57062 RepID=A0ABD1DZY2_HYPHA